jgi:hypothetical protein
MLRPKYTLLLAAATALAAFVVSATTALAQAPCHNCRCAPTHKSKVHSCCCCDSGCCCRDMNYMKPIQRAEWYNWNRNYANTQYGQPVALVVPPTAQLQTNWGWGVASSRISRLDHQFQRNYPGDGQFGGPFRTTPLWPSDTVQFGVYPVRGPW